MNKELYRGKAKTIYATEDENIVLVKFRDSATAFNGAKSQEIDGKGRLNNLITDRIFTLLKDNGIKTHYIKKISDTEQLVEKVDVFPLEVIIRNYSAGSFCKKYDFKEGIKFKNPIFEISYKRDDLGDPLLNHHHALALGLISEKELHEIERTSFEINDILTKFFISKNIILVDFKLEFGKNNKDNILLVDEFSPDNSRLWDKSSLKKLDKDNFRNDIDDLISVYKVVWERISND